MYRKWTLITNWKELRDKIRRGEITSSTKSVSWSNWAKHGLHESSIENELLVLASRGFSEMSLLEDKFPGEDLTEYLRELKKKELIVLV